MSDVANRLRTFGVEVALAAAGALAPSGPKPVVKFAPPNKTRLWPIGFELSGKRGETKTVRFQPQCLFRGEYITAVDDSGSQEGGAIIEMILIGNKIQGVSDDMGLPVAHISPDANVGTVLFDTCQPAQNISIRMRFDRDCTVYGRIDGRVIL